MGRMKSASVLRVFNALNSKLDYSVKLRLHESAVVMEGDKARVRLRAEASSSVADLMRFGRAFISL